uniref:Uncharacterized protein n=1 Tax=Knipowitschia caucasica TaxID=637954 RepID=A0AAV2K7J6_KNICA
MSLSADIVTLCGGRGSFSSAPPVLHQRPLRITSSADSKEPSWPVAKSESGNRLCSPSTPSAPSRHYGHCSKLDCRGFQVHYEEKLLKEASLAERAVPAC